MSFTLSVLLDDALLSLNRAVGVLRRRNLPIDSLSVGPTQTPGVSRLTVMLAADDGTADRLLQQMRKMVGVRQAVVFRRSEGVARELALIKVRAGPSQHAEVLEVVSRFKASVADEGPEEIIVEVAGPDDFVESLIRALEPYGVTAVARSGSVALERAGAEAGILSST